MFGIPHTTEHITISDLVDAGMCCFDYRLSGNKRSSVLCFMFEYFAKAQHVFIDALFCCDVILFCWWLTPESVMCRRRLHAIKRTC